MSSPCRPKIFIPVLLPGFQWFQMKYFMKLYKHDSFQIKEKNSCSFPYFRIRFVGTSDTSSSVSFLPTHHLQ